MAATGNSNSWKQFYESLPGDDEGNKNMVSFSKFCSDTSVDKVSKLRDLTEEKDSVFFGANNGKVIILHSPTNFGGTRSRKTNKVACLLGLGTNATGIILDEEAIVSSKKFKGADGSSILKCDTKEEIKDLAKNKNFKLGAIFFPAPFMRAAVMNLDSKDPFEIILASNKAVVESFGVGESEDAEAQKLKELANDHAEDLAVWLHGISINQIPETKYEVDPDDAELVAYTKERQNRAIMPSLAVVDLQTNPGDSAGVSLQLNQSLTLHAEAARESNLIRREEISRLKAKDEKEKDKVTTRIHGSVINMIKMAASVDGERPAPSVPDSCKAFWSCSSSGMAELELMEQLEQLGLRNVSFAHGTVVALYGGVLLYSVGGSPSNLSAFCFKKGRALKNNQSSRALTVHLVNQQGKGKSLEELKASAKQSVEVPIDVPGLEVQLKIFAGVLKVFLGKDNPASKGIACLLIDIENYSLEFESLVESDFSYPAKILYSVDTRIQRFMSQNKRMKDREEVSERLVDFGDLTDACLNQSFNVSLPPAFKLSKENLEDQSSNSRAKEWERKRKRTEAGQEESQVTNRDQLEEFKMKPGEDWRRDFVGKLNGDRPFWDKEKCGSGDAKMCVRYHTRGNCFEDCQNAASHVSSSQIPSDRKIALRNYLKKVRRA